jgi:hypothetical protein
MHVLETASAAPASEAGTTLAKDIAEKAALLTNPASGLANDFLNHFNEIFLLIENLPVLLPEMVDELMQWQPITYLEYFERSNLPGRSQALADYERIDPAFRTSFEALIDRLNTLALQIIAGIGRLRNDDGGLAAEDVAEFCADAALEFRKALDLASSTVNKGKSGEGESAQTLADRLLTQ